MSWGLNYYRGVLNIGDNVHTYLEELEVGAALELEDDVAQPAAA